MVFDTTIVAVVIPLLQFTIVTDASVAVRECRAALTVGRNTLDTVDFASLFTNSTGPPWMWFGATAAIFGAATTVTLRLAGPPGEGVRIKAQRRFRENDQTLWLVLENRIEAGDSVPRVDGFIRTLIRIP